MNNSHLLSIVITFSVTLMLSACALNIESQRGLNSTLLESTPSDSSGRGPDALNRLPLSTPETLLPYRWENRLLLIFSADSGSPDYVAHLSLYQGLSKELIDRDMVWFHTFGDSQNYLDEGLQPVSRQSAELANNLQQQYNPDRESFRIVLIGKDGGVKHVTNEPLQPDELFGIIDAMPMRQQEMREDN